MEQIARPDNVRRRAQILNNLAAIAVSCGRKAYGNDLFNRADILSSELTSESGLQGATIELSLSIAAQRRLCGDVAGADHAFSTIHNLIAMVTDQERKEQYLAEFTDAAAISGDFGLAKKTSELIMEPMRRTQASEAIARALLKDGRIQEAEMIVSTIPSLERISILLLIAESQMESQNAVVQKTLELTAKSLEDASDDYRAWDTANLASVEFKRGNRKRAVGLWKEAIKLSNRFTIHPERGKQNLIGYVARLQGEAGDEQNAMETAKLTQNDQVFFDIAEAEAANGKTESALKWINKQKRPEIKANSLLGVVSGLLKTKESKRHFGYIELSECK